MLPIPHMYVLWCLSYKEVSLGADFMHFKYIFLYSVGHVNGGGLCKSKVQLGGLLASYCYTCMYYLIRSMYTVYMIFMEDVAMFHIVSQREWEEHYAP